MRIGFLAPDLSFGNGWAHYSLKIIEELERQGVAVRVVSARNNDHPAYSAFPLLPTITPPDRNTLWQMARQFNTVRRVLADCDIIHATAEPYALLAAAIHGKRPLFITAHGSYVHLPVINRFPLNHGYRRAFRRSTLITVSHYTAQVAQEIVPDVKTIVINNGIDPDRYQNLTPYPHAPKRPILLAAGGVKKRKGTLELIEAIAIIRQTIPDVLGVVLGSKTAEPAYTQHVQARISELGLEHHVDLRGFVSDEELLGWHGASTIFAMPSMNQGWKFEGFGLAHLSASAAGLPVVSTLGCGVEDAVINNQTGLLVSQETVSEDLPQAILSILKNPEFGRQLGEAGRQHAAQETWASKASALIKAYEDSQR